MTTFQTAFFRMGLRTIERAWRESRKVFESEWAGVERQWQDHLSAVEAGKASPIEGDEETGAVYDYGEHIGEMQFEIEQCLRLLREAFTLTLYHFWEKEACRLLHLKRYAEPAAFEAAKADGRFEINEAGITRLRLTANCIKHDSGRPLFNLWPGMFDPRWLDLEAGVGWHSALVLTDEDLEDGFAAVRASGPRRKPQVEP